MCLNKSIIAATVVPELDLVLSFEVALGTVDSRSVDVLHVPLEHALSFESLVTNLNNQTRKLILLILDNLTKLQNKLASQILSTYGT